MTQLTKSGDRFIERAEVTDLSFTLFHQMPHQGYGRHAIERSQVIMRSPFLHPEVIRWLYRAPVNARRALSCSAAIVGRRRPDLLTIATDQGHLGSGGTARLVRRLHRQALIRGSIGRGTALRIGC